MITNLARGAIYGIALLTFSFCKEKSNKQVNPVKIQFIKEGELKLKQKNTDSVIGIFNIEIADDDYSRETGLMHRTNLNANEAMLFIFPDETYRYFYMKNTYIALDILYIDSQLNIVAIIKNTKPLEETSIPSQVPAKYVLEINAGMADRLQLKTGDYIQFNRD